MNRFSRSESDQMPLVHHTQSGRPGQLRELTGTWYTTHELVMKDLHRTKYELVLLSGVS